MKAIHSMFQLYIVLLVGFGSLNATAQVNDFALSVKASSSKFKTLVVETTYIYRVLELKPSLRISIEQYPEQSDANTKPERVLQEQFAAMKQGNYERFMSTWTRASQKEMDARNASKKFDKSFWIGKWHETLPGKAIDIKNFIVYSRFVLIQYSLVDATSGKEFATDTVAFVKENGLWKMTQELAYEAILSNWNSPTGRVQVPPESMIPPVESSTQ
jgi:hypothetical protein